MLVLSRRPGEIVIVDTPGGRIEIMLIEMRGDKVRLGIKAPSQYPVHRLEVAEAIAEREQQNGRP